MTRTVDGRMSAGFDLAIGRMNDQGACPPTFIFESADGTPAIFPIGWNGEQERAMAKKLVRLIACSLDAVAITMVSESWIASHQKRPDETEEQFRQREIPMPSQTPGRREGVVVAVAERGTDDVTMTMQVREIERDAKGKFSALADLDPDHDMKSAEGWLSGCIAPFPVPERLRKSANALLKLAGVEMQTIEINKADKPKADKPKG